MPSSSPLSSVVPTSLRPFIIFAVNVSVDQSLTKRFPENHAPLGEVCKKISRKPCTYNHAPPDKVYRKTFCPKKFSDIDYFTTSGT
jgi:hypothetical protein